MAEKIKEILDRLDFNEWEVDLYKVPITWCELYNIRDYITNLQQENEDLKTIIKQYVDIVLHDRKVIDDYKSRFEKAISAINTYQDSKTLSIGYENLKRIRGILRGNDFDIQMFEEYLKELKESGNNE